MSDKWKYISMSDDENIESIYLQTFESDSSQQRWIIVMKSGNHIYLSYYDRYMSLFTSNDLIAIENANMNINQLKISRLEQEQNQRDQELLNKKNSSLFNKFLTLFSFIKQNR